MPTTVKSYTGTAGDDSGLASVTQRVIATTLSSGSLGQVRATWKAGSGGGLAAANCSIGVATGTLANTVATPVELLFSGAHGFSIAAGASITSDWANLSFLSSDSLVVVLDNSASSTSCATTLADSYYFHAASASYNLATTPSGSTLVSGTVDAVILIETQASGGLPPGAQFFNLSPRRQDDLRPIELRTWVQRASIPLLAATQKPSDLGKGYTDRPQPPPWYRDWTTRGSISLLASTQKPSDLGRSYTERPPLLAPRLVDYTWIKTPQIVVSAALPPGASFTSLPQRGPPPPVPNWAQFNPSLSQDQLPAGKSYTDRPQPISWYREWAQFNPNLKQDELPVGAVYTDRPQPITWFRDWAVNLQQSTVAPPIVFPPGGNYTDRPQPITWYRDWSQNLLDNTLAVVYMPCRLVEIPNPTPYPRLDQTWIQGPQQQPSVAITLPPGKIYTDRPQPITWYREWLLNLQQSTLAPLLTLPAGSSYTDRPAPAAWYREWFQNLQETTLAPTVTLAGMAFTDLPQRGPPPPVPSWAYFNPNLAQDELPVGRAYTDRPQPPPWYRDWSLNLQQSTLAPPAAVFPPGAAYTDRPQPIRWFQSWTVNLQQFTPVGPSVLPPGATFTDLPQTYIQPSRSWESPYNVNLFAPTPSGPVPVRAGAVGRRRREREPRIDPWSKTLTRQHWKELQELIRAEADAAVEAERRDDPALAIAADAAREVAEALYLADETPTVNQDIVRITASLRAGAAIRAQMEAEALTAYLAMLEDEAECELLLFS